MKHRNPERMRANAKGALSFRYPKSINRIFNTQELPRLPRAEIQTLMDELVATGEVEKIEIGFMTYYRLKPLDLAIAPEYNGPQRNEFSLAPEADWFLHALEPLVRGKSVHLSFDDPRFSQMKNYRGKKQKRLAILVPGPMAGLKDEIILVSVVGSGCCLIRPKIEGHRIADLVLAGMPAKLATTLMNKLHLLFRSQENG